MFAEKNYLVHTLGLNGEMEILDHAQVNTNMILFFSSKKTPTSKVGDELRLLPT